MAKLIIPDKICPHCGGNEWYYYFNGRRYKEYTCAKKQKERMKIVCNIYFKSDKGKESLKKAKNKQCANLTDYYIIQNLAVIAWRNKYKLDRKSITKEQIEEYRQGLLAKRELKKLKYENK